MLEFTVMTFEEERITRPEEIETVLQIARKTLQESISGKKPISILVENINTSSPNIKLIIDRNTPPIELAKATYLDVPNDQSPNISTLESPANIPWLIIHEPKIHEELESFAQIGKYIPEFLENLQQNARKRPVWIYRSFDEYKLQLPFVKIRYFGRLLTANIAGTKQPTSIR